MFASILILSTLSLPAGPDPTVVFDVTDRGAACALLVELQHHVDRDPRIWHAPASRVAPEQAIWIRSLGPNIEVTKKNHRQVIPLARIAAGDRPVASSIRTLWNRIFPRLEFRPAPWPISRSAILTTCGPPGDRKDQKSGEAATSVSIDELWRAARRDLADQKPQAAAEKLRGVERMLRAGERPPLWHITPRPTESDDTPVGALFHEDNGTAFLLWHHANKLHRIDPDRGALDWTAPLDGPISLNAVLASHAALLSTKEAIVRMDLNSGRPHARAPMPRAESTTAGPLGLLFVAEDETISALDISSLRPRWTHVSEHPIDGAPHPAARYVFYLSGTKIIRRHASSGDAAGALAVEDEISSALHLAGGILWCVLGADTLLGIDPDALKVVHRFPGWPGLHWPPDTWADRLVLHGEEQGTPYVGLVSLATPDAPPIRWRGHAQPTRVAEHLVTYEPARRWVHFWDAPLRRRQRRRSDASDPTLYGTANELLLQSEDAVTSWRPDGTPAHRVQLANKKIQELAPGRRVHAVLLDDGAALGLAALPHPAHDAWREQISVELARAEIAAGRPHGARARLRAFAERPDVSLEVLQLWARALQGAGAAEQKTAWLRFLRRAPEQHPGVPDALTALTRLTGLAARTWLQAPVRTAVTATTGYIIAETATERVRLSVPDLRPVWRQDRSADPAIPFGPLLLIGDHLHDADTGEVRRPRPPDFMGLCAPSDDGCTGLRASIAPAHRPLLRWQAAASGPRATLRLDRPDGRTRWTQYFDDRSVTLLAADARHLLFWAPGTEKLHLLDRATGNRRWVRPMAPPSEGAPMHAELVGDVALLLRPPEVTGLRLTDSSVAFSPRRMPATVVGKTAPLAGGVAVWSDPFILWFGASGRVRQRRLPDVTALHALPGPTPGAVWAMTKGGDLLRLDEFLRPTRRLSVGPLRAVIPVGASLIAIEEGGGVLSLAP